MRRHALGLLTRSVALPAINWSKVIIFVDGDAKIETTGQIGLRHFVTPQNTNYICVYNFIIYILFHLSSENKRKNKKIFAFGFCPNLTQAEFDCLYSRIEPGVGLKCRGAWWWWCVVEPVLLSSQDRVIEVSGVGFRVMFTPRLPPPAQQVAGLFNPDRPATPPLGTWGVWRGGWKSANTGAGWRLTPSSGCLRIFIL